MLRLLTPVEIPGMKKYIALLLLFSFGWLFAQKHPEVNNNISSPVFFDIITPTIKLKQISEADLPQIIIQEADYGTEISLHLYKKIKSKALTHYRYHLYRDGIRLFAADAHIGVDSNQQIRLCKLPVLPPYINTQVSSGSPETIRNQFQAEEISKTEEVWYTDGSEYLQRGSVIILNGPESLSLEILTRGNEIVSKHDMLRYFQGPNDTTVTVMVFAPDPLTTAQVAYGWPYTDSNDISSPELEAERQLKNLTVTYENGQFLAKNDYAEIADFSKPNISPAVSSSAQMHYTRDQSQFEDLNALYHITMQKEHMINLGYPNIPNYTIPVDVHSMGGIDKSQFSPFHLKLFFGDGGVDDAEDADVIIHEYMHAAIFTIDSTFTVSTERGCIEEALGDYFAASYSNTVNLYGQTKVFDWDGHNEFWVGRLVNSTKDYGQQAFKTNAIYTHTDLFASPLMEINDKLGRNAADALVLEAMFALGSNTTMPQMAAYMLLSDTLLNNGINYQIIYDAFVRRNIIPSISLTESAFNTSKINVYNSMAFASGDPLLIRSNEHKIISYAIHSLNGQLMQQGGLDHKVENVLELDLPNLKNGVYVLTLTTSSGLHHSYKILRAY